MKNYYKILQIERSASEDEIKKAFKELAFEYHPDVCKYPNAHELFININEAYQVLGDENKKANYDLLYDRHFSKRKVVIKNEENIVSNIENWVRQAKEKAKKDAKTKFNEYAKNLKCYFNSEENADGPIYYFYVHKAMGLKGGTGINASIKSRVVVIPIPRSKKSTHYHHVGFIVKLFFLIAASLVFLISPLKHLELVHQIFLSGSLLLLGAAITYGIYHFAHTKSIFYYARKYFLVQKYLKQGYSVGFSPSITTTPFGLIYHIMKWLL